MADSQSESPETEAYGADGIALHLLGATQAAALACVPRVGRGDKQALTAWRRGHEARLGHGSRHGTGGDR